MDASGTWTRPNPLGADGYPALGETEHADRISYGIPDLRDPDVAATYAGKHVAVAGKGASAQGVLIGLAQLARTHPGTRVSWLLRRPSVGDAFGGGDNDQLEQRGRLGQDAKAAASSGLVTSVTQFRTVSVTAQADDRLTLTSVDGQQVTDVDEVIVVTGFRPDFAFLSEVRLDLDPALGAARALADQIHPDHHSCGDVAPHGYRELAQPEQGLYLVGMKSYGRAPSFLAMTGLRAGALGRRRPRRRPRGRRAGRAGAAGDRRLQRRRGLRRPRRDRRRPRGRRLLRPAGRRAAARHAGSRRPVTAPAAGGDAGPVTYAVPAGALGPAALRQVVAVLSTVQIVSWGVLYYAFAALQSSITADTGWSGVAVTGAFSLSQFVSGGVGIWVGRHIDAVGPRRVMTAASLVAVPGVGAVALAPSLGVFYLGWVLVGVAMAGALYPPAFAALTHWGGARRVRALTTLTLVAGLASTVFAPLASVLDDALGWRQAYLVLLGGLVLVTAPLHWWGLDHPWRAGDDPDRAARRAPRRLGRGRLPQRRLLHAGGGERPHRAGRVRGDHQPRAHAGRGGDEPEPRRRRARPRAASGRWWAASATPGSPPRPP